jgi:hypothetical protein
MKIPNHFLILGIVVLMAFSGISAAGAVTLRGGAVKVVSGSTTAMAINLDEAPTGLSGYNLTISVVDPAVAEIIGISYPEWAAIHGNSSVPGPQVWIKAIDLNNQVGISTGKVLLCSVILQGKADGESPISVAVMKMDDDSGNVIAPDIRESAVTVGSGGPAPLRVTSGANEIPTVSGTAGGNPLTDLIGQILAFIRGLLGWK